MKETILFLSIMLFTASLAFGQTALEEGFENGGAIPTGWTQEYVTGDEDWTFGPGTEGSGYPWDAHTGYYNARFYVGSSAIRVTKLVTPEMDLSTLYNPLLTFWHAQDAWGSDQDTLRVYYKTSAGGSWTLIPGQEYTTNMPDWTEEADIALPNPSSTYYIAFEGSNAYGYGVCVDDVLIQKTSSCPVPSDLTTTNITLNSADLSWTENGSATSWNIECGAAPYTFTGNPTDTGVSNPYNIAGLSANTEYTWKVCADCGGDSTSNWVGPETFTTSDGKATNPSPADNSRGILLTATTLDWDDVAGNGAISYKITIGDSSGGNNIANQVTCSISEYTHGSNWSNMQKYFWTVTTVYTATREEVTGDEWSFRTTYAAGGLLIEQGFNAETIPDGWSETVIYDPDEDADLTYVTSGNSPSCTPIEGTHMVKFDSYNCDDGDELRLESPEFSTTGISAARVWFSWYESSNYSSFLDEGVTVQWSLDGSVWNDGTFYQRVNATDGWYDKTYDLPAGAQGQSTVYVGFLFHSQYGYNCYFDDVIIAGTPTDPIFSVDPSSKDYGIIEVGSSSTAQTFTIQNIGVDTLTIDPAISITGTDAAQFILSDTNTYPVDLTSGQSMTVDVTFSPTSHGIKSANLHINDNLSRTAHDVALSGVGWDVNFTDGGTALDFDGTDDYVDCGNDDSLDITGTNITIEAWIYPTDFKTNYWENTIVGKDYWSGVGGSISGFALRFGSSGGTLSFVFGFGTGWAEIHTMNVLTLNTWQYVAAVYDGSEMNLYVNGESVATQSQTNAIVSSPVNLCIGQSTGDPGNRNMVGKMDEICLWNTARTTGQIRENMYLPLAGTETGLVGYWQFNEGSDNTAYDLVGGNHGTLTNMDTLNCWIESTIPFGDGVSNSQTEIAGTVDFAGTDLSMFFNSVGVAEITVTRIDTLANINPTEPETVFDAQYWVVNRFGTGTFDADLTFTLNEDLTAEDEANPSQIKLYTRSSNADTSWVYLIDASSVNAATDEVTFDGITEFSQFIIGRYTGTLDSPQNVIISIDQDSVFISWDEVTNANSYKIYAADNPYAVDWGSAVDTVFAPNTTWTSSITEEKKFYYVVASTDVVRGSVKPVSPSSRWEKKSKNHRDGGDTNQTSEASSKETLHPVRSP